MAHTLSVQKPSVRRRRGRPRLDETDISISLQVRLPRKHLRELRVRAHREGITVPHLVRRALRREMTPVGGA